MFNKKISIIVAMAQNGVIGDNNKLIWHIPDDLKRFKRITSYHTVVMGSKTYQSLPVKPLPNRRHIVITRDYSKAFDGCIMAHSIEEAIEKMDANNENFVIGGGEIYRQFLPFSNRIYLTRVLKDFDGDTFFPEILLSEWIKVEETKVSNDPKCNFSYVFETYKRKNL